MAKKASQTPGAALRAMMEEYQLTAIAVAEGLKVSQSAVRQILAGRARLVVSPALRLAKFFGTTPEYWLNLQMQCDLEEAQAEIGAELASIQKAKKPLPAKAGTGAGTKKAAPKRAASRKA